MVQLNVNGRDVHLDADPSTPILWALRDNLKPRKAQARARQDEPAPKAAPAQESPQDDPPKA